MEAYNAPGYPDAEAILIIDADGVEAEVADAMARIARSCARLRAGSVREATETRRGPKCGRGARRPSPPWAGWRPT